MPTLGGEGGGEVKDHTALLQGEGRGGGGPASSGQLGTGCWLRGVVASAFGKALTPTHDVENQGSFFTNPEAGMREGEDGNR